ncbi:MAG: HIT domain-containing protein [bacterium]
MEHIYAPWRKDFIENKEKKEEGCIFCNRIKTGVSLESLVVYKGAHSFVILNKYPYNNGHVMVVPYKHTSELSALAEDERSDLIENVKEAVEKLKEAYNPQGFNIGMNLGSVAGAGIAEHLHWHIVPRWGGDTNFMPVTAGTKVLHEMLEDTYKKLHPLFNKI